MRARILATTVVAVWSIVSPVAAQRPGSVEISALGVWHNKIAIHDGLRGFGVGGRLGVWLPAGFEVEAEFDATRPTNSASGNRYTLFQAGGGALYNYVFSAGPSVYVRAGYLRIHPRAGCRVTGLPCGSFGAFAGGAGFRIPITELVQVRAEGVVKTRSTYDYTGAGASLGVSIVTGGRGGGGGGGGAKGPDDDRDGVPNGRDRCRATARGALVDQRGCPTDLDGDGVSDGLDRCPATPKGTAVDPFGCPVKRPD